MRINDIKTYNQNTPHFGAKVKITGNTETLPQQMIDMIKANARQIGHRKDLIMFYFGKRQIDVLPCIKGDVTSQCRSVFVKSKISDCVLDQDLSYNVYDENIEDSSMIFEAVSEYLRDLRRYIVQHNKKTDI